MKNALYVAIITVAGAIGLAACSANGGGVLSKSGDGAQTGATPTDGHVQTDAEGNPIVTTKTGLPCDVDALLKKNCQTCHAATPAYGAPMPLVTYDDLQKPGVLDQVSKSLKGDGVTLMPPSPNPALSDADQKTFSDWVAGGAKSTADSCTGAAPAAGVKPLSCKPDTVFKATKPFTMQPSTPTDQYMCFGADVTLDKKRHVTGLAPHIDNSKIVHHILLFQSPSTESPEPFPCEAFGSAGWKLIAGWAPGGTNLELPPEAGFPENVGTTHWVLQIHYNNTNAKTGTDNSGYELCTTDQLRANDAGVMAFGSIAFSIPPRSTTTIKCDYVMGPQYRDIKMFNASPHMHTRGVAMSTEHVVGNGEPEKIFEQDHFSFEAQSNYPIQKQATVGDVMRTRCTWNNPGDQAIGFGEKTEDEMCFNFIGYYPAAPEVAVGSIPVSTWVTPSELAVCTPE
jgi:hypothetical protein